jgi:hypothetical protein
MKRIVLVFLAIFSMSMFCFSQDLITLKSGEQIRSKILEISPTDIRYKKFDNQSGPVYVVVKSDVADILYENGTRDVFSQAQPKQEPVISDKPSENVVTHNNPTPTAEAPKQSRFLIGFSGVYPTGTWPATALSNMGSTSFLKSQGNTVKSYGFGVIIQGNVSKHFSLFFDINAYDYNIYLGKKGQTIQTAWTVAEGAQNSNQLNVVLPDEIHFDMATTGFRLGGKYVIGNKKIRPWFGAAFGYYKWTANYFTADKKHTYGKDDGYVAGLTYLLGIDFELAPGIVITPFADLASPVAKYNMKDLIYMKWDIEDDNPIMGTSRFGLTLSFSPTSTRKN